MEAPGLKRKKEALRRTVRLLALVLALVCLGLIGWQLWAHKASRDDYEALRRLVIAPAPRPEGDAPQASDAFEPLQVDFAALQAQNPDVMAWLSFDALPISYPVVKAATNNQYLRRGLDGRYSTAGTLFMESANQSLDDLHTIIYGHNMMDGSMFAPLKKYTDPEFYRQNGGWFTLYTPEGAWRYQIFGIKQVKSNDPIYAVGFAPGQEYTDFLKQLCDDARLYNPGVLVRANDQVLTLSTCTDDAIDRMVVYARRDHALEE